MPIFPIRVDHIWNQRISPMTIKPLSHLHAEFQQHDNNVQSVRLLGCGGQKAGEKVEGREDFLVLFYEESIKPLKKKRCGGGLRCNA